MTNHDNKVYLQHILGSIEKVRSYLGETTFEGFKDNDLLIDGVVRNFEIIGEASNNISEDFKQKYPEINFRKTLIF